MASDGRYVYFKPQPKGAPGYNKGTRQTQFGKLGPNDPSYHAVMGRAQPINDTKQS